jgi:hypothetical protein
VTSIGHYGWLQHALAALILVSRAADVASTLVATPRLALEANPLVRRFKKPMLALGFVTVLLPYYDTTAALVFLVMSLLVVQHNLARGWMAQALGEDNMIAMLERAARRSSLARALTFVWAGAASLGLAGAVLMVLSGGPTRWPYWFAAGMLLYAGASGVFGSLAARRLFRRVRDADAAAAQPSRAAAGGAA